MSPKYPSVGHSQSTPTTVLPLHLRIAFRMRYCYSIQFMRSYGVFECAYDKRIQCERKGGMGSYVQPILPTVLLLSGVFQVISIAEWWFECIRKCRMPNWRSTERTQTVIERIHSRYHITAMHRTNLCSMGHHIPFAFQSDIEAIIVSILDYIGKSTRVMHNVGFRWGR